MKGLRPLRAVGLGALLGLGVAYPAAHEYSATPTATATAAPGTVVVQGAGPTASAGPAGPTAAASGRSRATPTGAASRKRRAHRASATAAPTTAAPQTRTLKATGPTVQTRYGPVQVQVTVLVSGSSEHIRSVTSLQLPSGGQSGQISAYAAPQLRQEALTAQSARIDTVSGASYTSAGYRSSLQAALVAARGAG